MGSGISALSEPFERKGRLHQHRGCSPVGFPEIDSDIESPETKEETKPIRDKPKASPQDLAAKKPPVIKPPTASLTPVAKKVERDKVPPPLKKPPPVRKSPPGTSESKKADPKPVTPRTGSARSRKQSLSSPRKPPTAAQQSAKPKEIPNYRRSSHRKQRRRSVRERNRTRRSVSNLNDSDSEVSQDHFQSSSDDEKEQKRDGENSFPPLQGRKVSLVGRQLSSEEARVSNPARGAEGGRGAGNRLAEPEALMLPPAPSMTSMVSRGSVTGQEVRRNRKKSRPDTRGSNDAALLAPPSMTYNASSLRDILMTVLSPGDEDPNLNEVRKKEDPDGWLDDKRGRLAKYLSLELYHESPESHAHYLPLPDSFPFRDMDTQSRESLLAIVPTLDVNFLTSLQNGSLDDDALIELISNMDTRIPTSEPSRQYPRHVYRLSYMKDALAKARRIKNWDEVKRDSMTQIKLVKIMVKAPKADRLPPISQKDFDDMRS